MELHQSFKKSFNHKLNIYSHSKVIRQKNDAHLFCANIVIKNIFFSSSSLHQVTAGGTVAENCLITFDLSSNSFQKSFSKNCQLQVKY